MITPIIREATQDDLPIISKLNLDIFKYEQAFGNSYDPSWTYSKEGQRYFTTQIKSKSALVLVAEQKKKVIGYLICSWTEWPFRRQPTVAELENMCVNETYRRQGIGTSLVGEMLVYLAKYQVAQIRVETLAGNRVAQRFYAKCGFNRHSTILEKAL